MNIRRKRLKDGRLAWKLEFSWRDPATGQPHRKGETFYGPKDAAQAYWVQRWTVLRQGEGIRDETQTVAEYLTTWWETVVQSHRKPKTARSYAQMIRCHIAPALGSIRLTQLTPAHLRQWVNAMGQNDALSLRTQAYSFAVLRAALNEAVRTDQLATNPCQKVRPPRNVPHPVEPFTAEQAQILLSVAASTRWEGVLVLAVGCGLRLGEILALRWPQYEPSTGVLHITETMTDVPGADRFQRPKTPESRRTIVVPTFVAEALTQQRRRQHGWQQQTAQWEDETLMFTTAKGGPLSLRNVQKAWYRICDQAGIVRRGFHTLRHTYASLALSAGVNLATIGELMGHTDPAFTKRVYAHLLLDSKYEAARELDRYWAKTGGNFNEQARQIDDIHHAKRSQDGLAYGFAPDFPHSS